MLIARVRSLPHHLACFCHCLSVVYLNQPSRISLLLIHVWCILCTEGKIICMEIFACHNKKEHSFRKNKIGAQNVRMTNFLSMLILPWWSDIFRQKDLGKQLRILLGELFDQGLHCLPLCLHFSVVKSYCSNFRISIAIFSGVPIFRNFTEVFFLLHFSFLIVCCVTQFRLLCSSSYVKEGWFPVKENGSTTKGSHCEAVHSSHNDS